MAALHSSSLLSRTRSGRVPNGKVAPGATFSGSLTSNASAGTAAVSTPIPLPTSNVSIFLTNLRLLDLDLLPDWPAITARTFASKDVTHGQKRRIHSVEWALYQLFCLWDPEEARSMRPFFPPADQVQSLNLRAALLRGLEQAKKNGTLGRDAIIRKTMLDDCRGERLEEILAVFSSAVLKKAVAEHHLNNREDYPAAAASLALENRGYSSERTQLHGLILAHKASLSRTLRSKEAAHETYRDFSELLDLKQRSLARRREFAKATEDQSAQSMVDSISEEAKQHLWKIVRNNWTGSEQWMVTLLHGDDHERKDELLATPYDRVWRRVQAGRLGELEGQGQAGLLEQLERQVHHHHDRLLQWQDYRRNVFGEQPDGSSSKSSTVPETRRGVDLGFNAHGSLYPTMASPRKTRAKRSAPLRPDYADLLRDLEAELGQAGQANTASLADFVQSRKAAARQFRERKPSTDASADEGSSEISDIDDHAAAKTPPAPPPDDTRTPTRSTQRVLLTDKSKAYSIKSYDSDDEPALLPQSLRRAATDVEQGSPTKLAQIEIQDLPIRRRQTAPLVPSPRPARLRSPPKTPSPTRPPPEMIEEPVEDHVSPPPLEEEEEVPLPTENVADEILASIDKASPSPMRKSRYTLSLAERTRMSMAHSSRQAKAPEGDVDEDDDNEPDLDTLTIRRHANSDARADAKLPEQEHKVEKAGGGYEDLIARTRKSMLGFEASRQRAQLERKRSQRKGKHAPPVSHSTTNGHSMAHAPLVEEEETTVVLMEELMSGEQDDAEAIFRSRPRIKMGPIPSLDDMY